MSRSDKQEIISSFGRYDLKVGFFDKGILRVGYFKRAAGEAPTFSSIISQEKSVTTSSTQDSISDGLITAYLDGNLLVVKRGEEELFREEARHQVTDASIEHQFKAAGRGFYG
ncbi:MAG: hypothetical protein ACP5T2_07135, partial [Thermoprotei archaeon]